jgi:serine/threonine-protein kinase
MNCELCNSDGQGGETRCRRCGFDTTLPPEVKRFLTSLAGFRPGELLEGRYRIDRILGFGGMSVVYKAHDDLLGEDVAIKVINGGRVADDAKLFTDIRRDIVTTRKLAHPNIVKIHDLHKADTSAFLTMEYVRGDDLNSLIAKRGKLEESEVCRLALQVADALSYAHANGVVHCDIKPGNLLLTETGKVKIADFGISRVMQEENTGLTGLVVGTPAYMSPEQIRGERPTPHADMYALGIVMWHCLTGAPPFTRGDIAYQHVHVPLPPLSGVSPELERIIRKAAAKTTAERYASLEELAGDLHRFLRQTDATIMQTPPPREAETIMQTPPPRQPILQTPPPQQVETVMHTPPPRPAAPAGEPAPPEGHGTTVMQTPPPRPAPVMETAPPQPAPVMETAPPRLTPVAAAPPSPPDAGPPPPAQPPAAAPAPPTGLSPANKKIALAAAAALIAGALLWGLLARSPQPQPQSAVTTGAPGGADAPAAGSGTATVVAPGAGSSAQGGGSRPVGSRSGISPDAGRPIRRPAEPPAPPPRQLEPPPAAVVASVEPAARERCTKAACIEIFDAALSPPTAAAGQTVRCTARFTFRHNEGGTALLEVEESAQVGIRSSRGVSRRVKAGPGPNLFEVSLKLPSRVSAGTYPVTLSVRRRSTTESVKLNLVVVK